MAVTPKIRVKVFPQSKLRIRSVPAIPGDAATVAVGTVTTLAPGADATVVNSGTSDAAVLDFGIPRGAAGIVSSVVAGTGVTVDATDPANPIVNASGAVTSVDGATGAVTYGAIVAAATDKATPVDADSIGLSDSAASNATKKLTWANLKATLKTYFDTLYQPVLATLTSWGAITRAAGVDTFIATPSWTNFLAMVTGEPTFYTSGGTDVSVADGGTGRSTSTTAYGLIAAGTTATGAHQTLPAGATTDILVGGGASALPVWTAATGSGAPVRASAPTFTGGAFNTTTFQAVDNGAGGPVIQFDHSSASPAANDEIGFFIFQGRDSAANNESYARITATILDPTSTSEDGQIAFQTVKAGSLSNEFIVANGTQFGSPTGGFKGAGTVNATAVYDDNTLLTCMAMSKEFIEEGRVDLDKWDAMVPDLVVPATKIREPVMIDRTVTKNVIERNADGDLIAARKTVSEKVQETYWDPVWDIKGNGIDAVQTPVFEERIVEAKVISRVHRTARVFKAMLDNGFDPRDPEQYFAKMQADEALPGMPTQADWQHNGLSMGEQFSRKWLAMEMLAIVCNVMWAKLKDHEDRLISLEAIAR